MSADTAFLINIGGLVAQILMLTAFYYAAFRRLFLNPTSNNLLVIVLFLVFFQIGYPLTWIWGWINSRARQTTWLMTFWTLAQLLIVLEFLVTSEAHQPDFELGISILGTLAMAGLTAWGLIPFFRIDERMRNLVREPSPRRVADFVALGPGILPELEMLLADNYQPTRLIAIECLTKLGPPARSILERASHDADPAVADAARDALDQLQKASV